MCHGARTVRPQATRDATQAMLSFSYSHPPFHREVVCGLVWEAEGGAAPPVAEPGVAVAGDLALPPRADADRRRARVPARSADPGGPAAGSPPPCCAAGGPPCADGWYRGAPTKAAAVTAGTGGPSPLPPAPATLAELPLTCCPSPHRHRLDAAGA